jgi:uncharacterized protein YqeY
MSTHATPGPPVADIQARLRLLLGEALRARDRTAASALRAALGALGNAEAVPVPVAPAQTSSSPYVAGASAGSASSEVERRLLSEAAAAAIVRGEIEEREAAAVSYERAGHLDRAAQLRREAGILSSAIGQSG